MPLPFHLGLRDRRHMVSLIRDGAQGRASRNVLGMAYPQDMNPRLRVLEQWGMPDSSPRRSMQATIDQPLPRRHQVALAAQLNPALQSSLHSGFEPQPVGRRETVPGVKGRVHLGPNHAPLQNGLPPLGEHAPHRGGSAAPSGRGRQSSGKPSGGGRR